MERKGLEDLSGALRKFAKERVTGIEGTTGLEAANPVISNAFATFTQQSLDIIRNSTTPNQAINKILPLLSAQRGGVGGIAGLEPLKTKLSNQFLIILEMNLKFNREPTQNYLQSYQ